jgi:hypothetical protein
MYRQGAVKQFGSGAVWIEIETRAGGIIYIPSNEVQREANKSIKDEVDSEVLRIEGQYPK